MQQVVYWENTRDGAVTLFEGSVGWIPDLGEIVKFENHPRVRLRVQNIEPEIVNGEQIVRVRFKPI